MGLLERIFRPKDAINSIKALREAKKYFGTLTAYEPVFHSWRGAIYEYELVRAAIDARARHISKLKADIHGTAQLSLQSKLKQGPNQWQTWSQFLYRVSTILDNQSTCFIAPVFDADMRITGYYPLLPEKCSIVEYEGEEYIVLIENDENADEVVILKINPIDEDTEEYLSIEDEDLLDKLFDIFKKKYDGDIKFE